MKKNLLYQNLGVKLARQDFVVQSFINRKKKKSNQHVVRQSFCLYVRAWWVGFAFGGVVTTVRE
jgi:hypothetical protein